MRTVLYQQKPGIEVLVLGGSPGVDIAKHAFRRGDWMTEITIWLDGKRLLNATVHTPPTHLSAPELQRQGQQQAHVDSASVIGGDEQDIEQEEGMAATRSSRLQKCVDALHWLLAKMIKWHEPKDEVKPLEKPLSLGHPQPYSQEVTDKGGEHASFEEDDDDEYAAARPLTTLVLTLDEVTTITSTGNFAPAYRPSTTAQVRVKQVTSKPIGIGFAETALVSITTVEGTFELMLWTAKAHKFKTEADKVACTHLDFKLVTWDRKTAGGALPELWGLRPMSEATKMLLQRESAMRLYEGRNQD